MKRFAPAVIAASMLIPAHSASPCSKYSEIARNQSHVEVDISGYRELIGYVHGHRNGDLVPPPVNVNEPLKTAANAARFALILAREVGPQRSEPKSKPAANAANDNTFDVGKIVDGIEASGPAAERLRLFTPAHVNVIDVSGMLMGANAAAIDTSMVRHKKDVERLRKAIAHSPSLSQALRKHGLAYTRVIAVDIDDAGWTTVFVL